MVESSLKRHLLQQAFRRACQIDIRNQGRKQTNRAVDYAMIGMSGSSACASVEIRAIRGQRL